MPMTVRLHIPPHRLAAAEVALEPDEVAYLIRVRRLAAGAEVTVFDGEGGEVAATLESGGARLRLGERRAVVFPRRFRFELWQGLAKGDKLDLVVQKATELGASRIVPFASARAVVKLFGERAVSRTARLSKIAEEAARQCGRADVPQVAAVGALHDLVAMSVPGVQRAILYEREGNRHLWPWLGQVQAGATVALAVGPEGGFAPEEVALAQGAGVAVLGLGDLVLRTETAGIVACTLAALAAGALAGLDG